MSPFSLFKKKSNLLFIIDVKEFSIAISVLRKDSGTRLEMITCKKFSAENNNSSDYKKAYSILLNVLDNAIVSMNKILLKMGIKEKVQNYYFFVGSPWVVAKSKEIKYIKDKDFLINSGLLKKILVKQKELQLNLHKNWCILDEKIVEVKLNGYKVNDFFNKKAKELEITLFTSFIEKNIFDKLESHIKSKIKNKFDINVHSQTLSTFTFVRDLYNDRNNFIFVDIGKLLTDVYVVINDVIHGISSFPIGENKILQDISEKTNLPQTVIDSLINIKCHGKCDEETDRKINSFIEFGFEKWLIMLKETVEKMSTERELPNEILTIDGLNIVKLLKNANENRIKIHNMQMKISIIEESLLNNFITNAKNFKGESILKIDSIFIGKLLK